MNSFHDYHIHSYEVNSLDRALTFRLVWPNGEKNAEVILLRFSGVHGYELNNDSMVSIVNSFEEIQLAEFISEFSNEIKICYEKMAHMNRGRMI